MQEKSPGSDHFVAVEDQQGLEIQRKLTIQQELNLDFVHQSRRQQQAKPLFRLT